MEVTSVRFKGAQLQSTVFAILLLKIPFAKPALLDFKSRQISFNNALTLRQRESPREMALTAANKWTTRLADGISPDEEKSLTY